MKYYAIAETKLKVKDELGKESNSTKTVVLDETVVRSRPWNQRVVAQSEAERYCKANRMTLQAVYPVKGAMNNGGIMTKGIAAQKGKKHTTQQRRFKASLRG